MTQILKEKAYHFAKGIEVGNTFKLGVKYSQAMNLQYLDQENKLQDVYMGSYGIGIGRTMAAIVEQNADEHGINWPEIVAPFKVAIVVINPKNEKHLNYANKLYDELTEKGIEVIMDDRDQRPGVKFNDMELIGIPYRITVGRGLDNGEVELKKRTDKESVNVAIDKIVDKIVSL